MTELAPLDNYQGSVPETVVFPIEQISAATSAQIGFFITPMGSLWRLRYLNVGGFRFAGVGTSRLGLFVGLGSGEGTGWTNGNDNSGTNVTPEIDIQQTDNFTFTWSTEVGTAVASRDPAQGVAAVAPWPLFFMPGNTFMAFSRMDLGGSTSDLLIQDGTMEMEKFPLGAVATGGDTGEQRVFLLQAARPGDAGASPDMPTPRDRDIHRAWQNLQRALGPSMRKQFQSIEKSRRRLRRVVR